MSDLLHNVWHDLREKRLWPVAAVLVIALVAIPVLLTKSSAQTPVDETGVVAPAPDAERVTVKLDGGDAASTGTGSSLEEFAKGDPFTPPSAIAKGAGAGAAATASLAGPSEAPSAGAGGESAPPASTPDAPSGTAPPVTRTDTTEYEYVADVTFWNGERRRRIKGLRKLDMLPNQSAPVLIFMGTSEQGGNAVFLVDSTLKAAGEGRCVPSPANCAYVHIGPGSEHAFSTEAGDSYRVRVDEIRRVEAGATARAGRRRAASSSAGDAPAVRRFVLPALADLVAVETTETVPGQTHSSVRADGR